MAKQKIETSIEINGIDVVAYPLVESDHVTFENGMSINEMIKGDVVTPVVTHEETSFKVGKGDSDVSSSIVDGSVGEMIIKGQTYQNILPEPSLRNSMGNGKTTQKFNEGYDNINVVDGVGKSAILKGQTLVNIFNKVLPTEPKNYVEFKLSNAAKANTTYTFFIDADVTSSDYSCGFLNANGGANGWASSSKDARSFTRTTNTESSILKFMAHGSSNTILIKKLMIIEGDYTNQDIPFFTGMQSVKSPSLASVGKNLFDKRAYSDLYFDSESLVLKAGNNYARSIVFKVNKNESYIVSGVDKLLAVNNSNVIRVLFTRDTPNIGNVSVRLNNLAGAIVAPENGYILLGNLKDSGRWTDEEWINAVDTIQIEQGSQATTYEPHKSNTLTTPSDLTLRGIGDVCDTLDLVSGEKVERILEVVFDGSNDESWVLSGSQPKDTSFVRFDIIINKRFMVGANGLILCDKIPYLYIHEIGPRNIAQECVSVHSVDEGAINLIIKKEKLTEVNVTKFKEWLSKNPLTVQCKLKTPTTTKVDLSSSGNWEKVVLDGSENWNKFQIDSMLRHSQFYIRIEDKLAYSKPVCDSFVVGFRQVTDSGGEFVAGDGGNGKNIWVNILNSRLVSLDVNGFKAFLRENPITVWYQTTTHQDSTQVKQLLSFSNGHIQLTSKDGSLIPSLDYEVPTSNSYHMDLMKPSTVYTMKNMSETFTIDGTQYNASANGTFTTPSSMTNKLMITSVAQSNAMLLEGNLTSKTIPYFKGIKSAFEGEDEIEVLSVGKNLWDNKVFKDCPIATINDDGSVTLNGKLNYHWMFDYMIDKGTYYASAIGNDTGYIHLFWGGGDEFFHKSKPFTISEKVTRRGYVASGTYENAKVYLQLEQGMQATPYEPYKSNITKIPLSSPLRSLPNGVCDEVILDRENNKVKVIQRVGYEVFDGSENWQRDSFNFANRNFLRFITFLTNVKTNGKGLCDKLPVLEGDKFGVNYIRPSIDRTWIYKADLTVTTDSFVRELSNDPLMLHYELATPIITEIDLDGYPYIYKDGHIFLNSKIAPTTTMKYSINQSHQIASQNGDLIRHEKEINYLYTLIAKYVNVQYESTLLNLDLELSRA